METNENDRINQLILEANFDEAFEVIGNKSVEDIFDIILPYVYEKGNILYYGFAVFLINKEESSERHYFASMLLSTALNYWEGAYNLAFFHAKKAINLSPDDISYKKYLLLFYNIPQRLLGKEEAIEIAKSILEKDSYNQTALQVYSKK